MLVFSKAIKPVLELCYRLAEHFFLSLPNNAISRISYFGDGIISHICDIIKEAGILNTIGFCWRQNRKCVTYRSKGSHRRRLVPVLSVGIKAIRF